jgi:hypothetical protein
VNRDIAEVEVLGIKGYNDLCQRMSRLKAALDNATGYCVSLYERAWKQLEKQDTAAGNTLIEAKIAWKKLSPVCKLHAWSKMTCVSEQIEKKKWLHKLLVADMLKECFGVPVGEEGIGIVPKGVGL